MATQYPSFYQARRNISSRVSRQNAKLLENLPSRMRYHWIYEAGTFRGAVPVRNAGSTPGLRAETNPAYKPTSICKLLFAFFVRLSERMGCICCLQMD